jgi:hypothetical protein
MRDPPRRARRLLQVALLMRSVAPYEHIKAAATLGECGRLLSLESYRLGSHLRPGAPDHKAHYSDPSTELMTFDYDFANRLQEPPVCNKRADSSAKQTANGWSRLGQTSRFGRVLAEAGSVQVTDARR